MSQIMNEDVQEKLKALVEATKAQTGKPIRGAVCVFLSECDHGHTGHVVIHDFEEGLLNRSNLLRMCAEFTAWASDITNQLPPEADSEEGDLA